MYTLKLQPGAIGIHVNFSLNLGLILSQLITETVSFKAGEVP